MLANCILEESKKTEVSERGEKGGGGELEVSTHEQTRLHVPGDVAVKGPDSYIVGNKAEDDVGVGGDDDGVPPSNSAKRGKKVKKRREGGRER